MQGRQRPNFNYRMIRHFFIFLFVFLSGFCFSQNTNIDSLKQLLADILDEKPKNTFTKVIVIGNKGCNLQSATGMTHDGQFKEVQIPFPKETSIDYIHCENYLIDSSSADFNVLKVYSKEIDIGITNNCKIDNVSLKLDEDSIFTITNIGRNYTTFEELEEIEGFGATSPYTSAYISLWLHPSFEFISIKENVNNSDFIYKEKNEIVLKATNINSLAFEIKYRRKKSGVKLTNKDIHVKGETKLKVYDNGLEDGDVINVFVDEKLILNNYKATKKQKSISIKTKAINHVRIENVNEGKIPPNTVVVEVINQDKIIKIDVKTAKLEAYQLNLIQD